MRLRRQDFFKVHEVEHGGLKVEVMDRGVFYYTRHHEWVEVAGGCPCMGEMARIGMGDFAYKAYGKLLSFQPRERIVNFQVQVGDEVGELHLERGVVALLAPIDGNVLTINREVEQHPEVAAEAPYNRGWIAYIRPAGELREALQGLLRPAEYIAWLKDGAQGETGDGQ